MAVLVELPEHANALKSWLRDWPVVDMTRGREAQDLPPQCILTLMGAQGERVLCTDILIQAMGVAPPTLPTLLPTTEGAEVLVVDLADDQDRVAKDHVQARVQDYLSRGWIVEQAPGRQQSRGPRGRHPHTADV